MSFHFYQIYYAEEQKQEIYPFAIPHYNEGLSIFFENEVIASLVQDSRADKVAVCSWKLKKKLKWYLGRPRPITPEVLESDYDVLSFTKNSNYHQMLNAADVHHPGFKATLRKIVEGIGKKMPHEVKQPIYQNHFSAKREIYGDYVKNWLVPSMELIKNDAEVYKLATVDSKYHNLNKKDAATRDYLKEKIGFGYYPLVPFLLERLFSIYVDHQKIKVTWL